MTEVSIYRGVSPIVSMIPTFLNFDSFTNLVALMQQSGIKGLSDSKPSIPLHFIEATLAVTYLVQTDMTE